MIGGEVAVCRPKVLDHEGLAQVAATSKNLHEQRLREAGKRKRKKRTVKKQLSHEEQEVMKSFATYSNKYQTNQQLFLKMKKKRSRDRLKSTQ